MSRLRRRSIFRRRSSAIPADDIFAQFTTPVSLLPGTIAYPVGSFIPGSGSMTGAGGAAFNAKFKTYIGMDTRGIAQYNAQETLSVVQPTDGTPPYFDIWHRTVSGIPRSIWLRVKTTPELKLGGQYFAWIECPPIAGYGATNVLISEPPRGTRSDGSVRPWYEFSDENDTPEMSLTSEEISASWHPYTGDFGGHPIVHNRDIDHMLRLPGGLQFLTQKFAPAGDYPGAIIERVRRPTWPAGKWALWFRQGKGIGPEPESWTFQSGAHQGVDVLPISSYGSGHMRIYAMKVWDQIPGTRPDPMPEVRFPDDFSDLLGNPQYPSTAHTRAMAFKVTEACTFEGITFYSPFAADDAQTVTAQLWRGTTLIDSRTVSDLTNGRYPIRMTERTLDTTGDWQVQIAMDAGHAGFTVTTLPSNAMTVGPVTTVGVTNPMRYGSDTAARATLTGSAWCGMGVMVRAATPVQYPPGTTPAAQETTVQTYLARSGTDITLNGTKWRGAGVNWHWAALRETNLQYPTHAMIDEILNECVTLGVKFIRAHTLGMSAGLSQSLVTSVNADGTLVWNTAAWEPIDYVVQQAKLRGIRLLIPFFDQFDYYHKGKQWWVQQAFIQRATSGIPSTYTYGGTTETGVISFDPASGTVAGSQRYKIISQQFYRNTWTRAAANSYVSQWYDHVNQYTGTVNKNEPTLAFAQYGNELWDSGDKYADHAGADGISALTQFAATVKGKNPSILVVDGIGADGVDPDFAPGRNIANVDIIDAQHLYANHGAIPSGMVTGFAADVAAFNKPAFFGEYPTNNAGLAGALAEIEQTGSVMGAAFWAIYSSSEGHNQGSNVDDTVYLVGGGGSKTGWKGIFQAHAAVMSGGTVPTAPVLVNRMQSSAVANCEAAATAYSTGASTGSSPSRTIESGTGVTGSALRVAITDAGYKWVYPNTPVTNGAPVTAGSTYTMTAHAKLASGTLGSGYYGHLTWYTADGTYIGGNTSSGTVTATGSYVQVTFTGTAPATAAYAIPQIEFTANGSAVLLIDQWGVMAGNSASPWVSP